MIKMLEQEPQLKKMSKGHENKNFHTFDNFYRAIKVQNLHVHFHRNGNIFQKK